MQGGEISVTRSEVFSWILCTMINIYKNNKAWMWRCSTEQWCRPRKQWKDCTADYEGSLDLRKEKRLCSQIQYSVFSIQYSRAAEVGGPSPHILLPKSGVLLEETNKSPFSKDGSESQTSEVSPPSPLRLARGPTGTWTNHWGREIYVLRSQTWPASSFSLLNPPPDLLHRV